MFVNTTVPPTHRFTASYIISRHSFVYVKVMSCTDIYTKYHVLRCRYGRVGYLPHSVRIFSSSEDTECTVTNCSIETVDQQICSLVWKHKINKKRRNVERMSSSHSLNPMNWKYLSWHSLWFYPWTRKTRQAKQGARFYTRIIPQTSYTRSSTFWTISFTILINSINYTGYEFNLYIHKYTWWSRVIYRKFIWEMS